MLETIRGAALMAATLTGALQAGLYYAFSCAVLPGLDRGDPRPPVAATPPLNVAITHPFFLAPFLGAPLLAALAAVLGLGAASRSVLLWATVGAVLTMATFVITAALNVPLNDALDAAGDPTRIVDPAAVAAAFAPVWERWNTVRAVSSTVSVACLAWALVEHGRALRG